MAPFSDFPFLRQAFTAGERLAGFSATAQLGTAKVDRCRAARQVPAGMAPSAAI